MTKEEKELLKEIAKAINEIANMQEENQQQAAEESAHNAEEESNHDDHEEDGVSCDEVDFVKGMVKNDILGLKFIAFYSDGHVARGQIGGRVFNAMCNAFLEKYA